MHIYILASPVKLFIFFWYYHERNILPSFSEVEKLFTSWLKLMAKRGAGIYFELEHVANVGLTINLHIKVYFSNSLKLGYYLVAK